MHRPPDGPALNQSAGFYILTTDGKSMERMGQKLGLHSAQVLNHGFAVPGGEQILSPEAAQENFFSGHGAIPPFGLYQVGTTHLIWSYQLKISSACFSMT